MIDGTGCETKPDDSKTVSEKKEYWGLRPGAWMAFISVVVTILTLIGGIWRAQDVRISNLVTDMRVLESEVAAAKAKAAKQEETSELMMSQLTEIRTAIQGIETTLKYISARPHRDDSAGAGSFSRYQSS